MNKRIKQLDFLRLLFSIIILLSHIDYLGELNFTRNIYRTLIKSEFAVDYFFLLSGFGIYIYIYI